MAGEHLDHALVDVIEVGPFFTVDFNVDKMLVHQGRNLGVFKGFVLHDMAPMAGGIPN